MDQFPPLLTTPQAAQRLGINRVTVVRWVNAGRLLPAMRCSCGAYLFHPQEVARAGRTAWPSKRRGRKPKAYLS